MGGGALPENLATYRVFVSSPGDLGPQRLVAKQAIESLSPIYERRGIRIVPWLWEDWAVSELGQPAQTIITSQLGPYDIYIGIMGARFGSPTERFGSGTEEEFNDALAAHRQTGKPKLSFFFQEVTFNTNALNEHTLDQLGRVYKFRTTIGGLGLYREFAENHTLSALVTTTVSKFIDDDNLRLGTTAVQLNMGLESQDLAMTISRAFAVETLDAMDDNLTVGGARVSLDSVWIEPEFRDLSGDDGKTDRPVVSLKDELPHLEEPSAGLLISGAETSGRSVVCRRLFRTLFAAGHIPVLVNAEQINNPDTDRFKRRLRVLLEDQYDNVGTINDKTLKEKCIVLIDDWDGIRLSRSHAANLLAAIREAYHGVVATVRSGYEFQWLESTEEVAPFATFRRIEIADLGNRKRYALIERWCGLLNHATDVEPHRDLVQARRKIVNRVLGSNLVPRTPFMVLILLQAIDAGKESDLLRTGYIRYYKFLIDSAILRNVTPKDAEGAYALLPELAWEIYCTGAKVLSAASAEKVIERFAEQKALSKGILYSVLGSLQTIGMFDTVGDTHRFRHPYAYYFFLAEYISAQMHISEMQQLVVKLCREVSIKESATLLVFLSYHSETKLITETLLCGLATLYPRATPFEFSADRTAGINMLFEVPTMIFDPGKTSEQRLRRLDAEEREEAEEPEYESAEEGEPVSTMINVFTTVEILGHILRNHYARLDAQPKLSILDSASAAILRCLGDIFDALAHSGEALVRVMSVITPKVDSAKNRDDKIKAANEAVFYIAHLLIFYCGRQLARAVGDENLEVTYRQVLKAHPSEISRRFLDVVLKLESFRSFPLEEVRELTAELRNNGVAMAALRLAVAERLDMQPPSPSDLQRICDMVQLRLKPRILAKQLR